MPNAKMPIKHTQHNLITHRRRDIHTHTHTSHLSEWNTIINKYKHKNWMQKSVKIFFTFVFFYLSPSLSVSLSSPLLLHCVHAYNTFWIKHNNNNALNRVRVIILNGAAASTSLTLLIVVVVVAAVFGTANCWPSPLPTQCGHLVALFFTIPILSGPLWPRHSIDRCPCPAGSPHAKSNNRNNNWNKRSNDNAARAAAECNDACKMCNEAIEETFRCEIVDLKSTLQSGVG